MKKTRTYKVKYVDSADVEMGVRKGERVEIIGVRCDSPGGKMFECVTDAGFIVPLLEDQLVGDSVEWGVLFNWRSFWVGCHYSRYNRRFCINLIPGFTFWITKKGGKRP